VCASSYLFELPLEVHRAQTNPVASSSRLQLFALAAIHFLSHCSAPLAFAGWRKWPHCAMFAPPATCTCSAGRPATN